MSPDAITFGRKTDVIEDGPAPELALGPPRPITLDRAEKLYASCFPPMPSEPGPTPVHPGARNDRRATASASPFDSLHDLIRHMGAIREGRTAVITVTDGWVLYQPERALTHLRRDPITGNRSRSHSWHAASGRRRPRRHADRRTRSRYDDQRPTESATRTRWSWR